jgi:4-amino-4-deoxychorismate lyase
MEYHNRRFNETCRVLFGLNRKFDLNLQIRIPAKISNQRYKYRILFDGQLFETHIEKYTPRPIGSLQVVHFDDIEYTFKTTKRDKLDEAYGLRKNCDDVIIVRNGLVTDTFASNILLYNDENWITPSSPLLRGVQRSYLIDSKQVIEKEVSVDDLGKYSHIKLINALIPFERADKLDVRDSVFFDTSYSL